MAADPLTDAEIDKLADNLMEACDELIDEFGRRTALSVTAANIAAEFKRVRVETLETCANICHDELAALSAERLIRALLPTPKPRETDENR